MIKAFILDDEASAITTLTLMLKRYVPEITHVQSATSPAQALQSVRSFLPHLVFLDIQMPVINGFEWLKKIQTPTFDIIFTTAHDNYAIQAIRFSALDYLLKPINANELRAAMNRFLLKRNAAEEQDLLYRNLLHNVHAEQKNFKLAVSTTDGCFFFNTDEIIRLEAEGAYTLIRFTNRKPLLVSKILKDYEELLGDHGFVRLHKSHLVNVLYITAVSAQGNAVLSDGSMVEISRRRKGDVMDILKRG